MNTEHQRKSTDAVRADRSGRGDSAEIILIPKALRAEWMDAMALDPALSPLAFKVAGVIGSHFNRHTGDTFVSQDTLADVLQMALRTVQKAIGELEARGYLIVRRRELGQRGDGRRVCGGRGVANTYLPAFERSQVAATSAGRRFADRIEEAWQRTRDRASIRPKKDAPACVHSGREGGAAVRPLPAERTQNQIGKDAPACVPTLGDPSDHNPARGRAAARVNAAAHPLGAAADRLRSKLGAAFETWFAEVTVIALDAATLRLAAPSPFVRDWLAGRHDQDVRDAWNRSQPRGTPLIDRVVFEVRTPAAGGARK